MSTEKEKENALKVLVSAAIEKEPELSVSFNDFSYLRAYVKLLEEKIKATIP